MPLFNSCPLGASLTEYSAYIERTTTPVSVGDSVLCGMNYGKNTSRLPEFVRKNAQHVREVVDLIAIAQD